MFRIKVVVFFQKQRECTGNRKSDREERERNEKDEKRKRRASVYSWVKLSGAHLGSVHAMEAFRLPGMASATTN